MSPIGQPRHFCALGAQQSVLAIRRAVPILHAGPGCGAKLFGGLSFCNGFQGSGYAGGNAVPCTNVEEKEIVFGGEARLRKVIEGALKVMDADFFAVLTGCASEIVGDDAGSVVEGFRKEGVPIVHAATGGFKGTSYEGHEMFLEAVIDQFLAPAEGKVEGLVNVLSVVPNHDPFWNGNLEELERLLSGLGLVPNVLFGSASGGVDALRRIPAAQFNLVVSPWVGLRTAERLKERFGTPYLHCPVLPIGATETGRFLRAVAAFAGLPREKTEAFIEDREARYYSHLERAADFLLEFRYDLPGRFFTIADSFYALGIGRFLASDLGMLPGCQFVTEGPPEAYRSAIEAGFTELAPGVASPVTFSRDGGRIHDVLREFRHDSPPLILGSAWDRDIARELKGYHLGVSLPVTDRLVLDRHYVGYRGGLRLAEDIYAAILGSQQ